MVLHTASWWPGCTPFKASLKDLYLKWNADGAKNLQVITVSGDQNEDGFNSTMKDMPWIAQPHGTDKAAISELVPCTGYPTPGVVNVATGAVIDADCFGKVDDANYNSWMAALWSNYPTIWLIYICLYIFSFIYSFNMHKDWSWTDETLNLRHRYGWLHTTSVYYVNGIELIYETYFYNDNI